MIHVTNIVRSRLTRRVALALASMIAMLLLASADASAVDIVPSAGWTRSVDADDAKSIFNLALRGSMVPLFQTEIGVGYRRETYFDGDLTVKMWPITASLLLSPIPMIHADAGAGWYHTTYAYENPALDDETKQKFGVHAGGGFYVPLAPRAALDLTGRYVFMREQESRIVPEKFNPDFWTLSLGIALKL
jgi:opacity protein-like surface antigen